MSRSLRKATAVLMLVLLVPSQVFAWGDHGHKVIASIAFRRLSKAEQAKIVDLIKKHPRFKDDFEDQMPSDIVSANDDTKNEWLFQQAAIWPDLARGFPDELKTQFHRSNWHFINLPVFLTPADQDELEAGLPVNVSLNAPATPRRNMNVVQTIRFARRTLNDDDAPAKAKGLMLPWLFHTTGDLAQPLHSSALFSRKAFPEGDLGGNKIRTTRHDNLHLLWDRFPRGNASFKDVRTTAVALMGDARLAMLGDAAAGNLNEETWLNESHEIAKSNVYTAEVLAHVKAIEMGGDPGPLQLSDQYLKTGAKIADERLVQAGYRLGAVLKEIAAAQ